MFSAKPYSVRRLWLLAGLVLIGLNAFEGYWLWRQWQQNQRDLLQSARDALLVTTHRYNFGDLEATLDSLQQGNIVADNQLDSVPRNSQRIVIALNGQTGNMVFRSDSSALRSTVILRQTETTTAERVAITSEAIDLRLPPPDREDSISQLFTKSIRRNWLSKNEPADFERLGQLFSQELQKRQINLNFRLDTFTEARLLPPPPGRYDDPASVSALLNPIRGQHVKVSFDNLSSVLLSRLTGAILAAVMLLLLTAGTLFYLIRVIRRQRKVAEMKTDFINTVTHELQTPIATATAAVEALQNFDVLDRPERTREYLGIARQQLEQLSGMVDQTLRLAMEEKGDFTLHIQPESLDEVITPLLRHAELSAGKPLQLQYHNELTAPVMIDRAYFAWAIQNLLENAIKYGPASGVIVKLTAKTTPDGWSVSVTDNGPGIPAAYHSQLFERFFRIPETATVKGFGLGLYIVKRIIEGHGGRIQVDSSPGRGSTFVLLMGFAR